MINLRSPENQSICGRHKENVCGRKGNQLAQLTVSLVLGYPLSIFCIVDENSPIQKSEQQELRVRSESDRTVVDFVLLVHGDSLQLLS